MSNVFVIIKMCYVHNQWYDISCATSMLIYVKRRIQNNAPGENQINIYHPEVRKNSKRSVFLKRIKSKLQRKEFRKVQTF